LFRYELFVLYCLLSRFRVVLHCVVPCPAVIIIVLIHYLFRYAILSPLIRGVGVRYTLPCSVAIVLCRYVTVPPFVSSSAQRYSFLLYVVLLLLLPLFYTLYAFTLAFV